MNKRIKELMPKPWTFPYPDRELYTKEQFEKFAELIVRECALTAGLMEQAGRPNIGAGILDSFGIEA